MNKIIVCDICGANVKKNGGLNAGKLIAKDGVVCRPCYIKSGIRRPKGNISDLTVEQVKDFINGKGDISLLNVFTKDNKLAGRSPKGLPGAAAGTLIEIYFDNDEMVMDLTSVTSNRDMAKKTYRIKAKRLLSAEIVTDNFLKEKNKSVIGRGIVGGLLFGGVGALLGGMSGIGTKTVASTGDIPIAVAYEGKDGEIKNFIFYIARHKLKDAYSFISDFIRNAPPLVLDDDNGDIHL